MPKREEEKKLPKRKGSSKEVVRSHSNPGTRRPISESRSSKLPSRKSLLNHLRASNASSGSKNDEPVPPEKIIRGGSKKSSLLIAKNEIDIPFIDETVDAEGNILSPVKLSSTVSLVNGDKDEENEEEVMPLENIEKSSEEESAKLVSQPK